jgi:hypothetical protein
MVWAAWKVIPCSEVSQRGRQAERGRAAQASPTYRRWPDPLWALPLLATRYSLLPATRYPLPATRYPLIPEMPANVRRAASSSRLSCACNAAGSANRCTSRRRDTNSMRTKSP